MRWDPLAGAREISRDERAAPAFTDEQITAAVAAANALPAVKKNNPNKVATFWPQPDQMPTIADVDFRDIATKKLTISTLQASNDTLKRDKLIWHCQNPGETSNPSPFTTAPLVLDTDDGQIIVDGQHRLAALQLLGQTSWPCWLLPSN